MAAEETIKNYRDLAIKNFSQSIDKGYNDFEWAAKDLDLKSLQDDPEFKTLLQKKAADPAKKSVDKTKG